ncbi:MAG: hypothetical protein K2K20_00765, partial [Lachnospiraceae bacterium]|nr:hypothetical protein [Lachnospiraceae bacterium]
MKLERKKIILFSIIIILFLTLWVGISIVGINEYLKEYGYSTNEMPQTLAVYFLLTKGFTVAENENSSTFIGNHYYIYDDILEKNGYHLTEQMGTLYIYENEEQSIIRITSSHDWCHWFRIYTIDG